MEWLLLRGEKALLERMRAGGPSKETQDPESKVPEKAEFPDGAADTSVAAPFFIVPVFEELYFEQRELG